MTEIHAKFDSGRVYITLPKLVVAVPPPRDQTTQTITEDKKATEPKLQSTDQNEHSKKANGEQREEKKSDPLVDAQNKVEDNEADQSDKDSESTSNAVSEAESTERPQREPTDSESCARGCEHLSGRRWREQYTVHLLFLSSPWALEWLCYKLIESSSGASGGTDLVPIIPP